MLDDRQGNKAVDAVWRKGQPIHAAHDVYRVVVEEIKSDNIGMDASCAGSNVDDQISWRDRHARR